MKPIFIDIRGQKALPGIFHRIIIPALSGLLVLSLLLAAGCTKTKPARKTEKKAQTRTPGIHKTFERGPVTCKIDIDKSEITIAERLNFRLTVTVDPDYSITLPEIGKKLSDFGIVDFHAPPLSITKAGRKKIVRTYVLEPFLSGDYIIPEMNIYFKKNGEKERHKLETEKITVHVKSLLPADVKNLKIADIRPPENMPERLGPGLWIAGGAALVLIACLIGFIIYRRRHADPINAEILIPPHERAFAALKRLVEENLVEKGEIKRFYHEISDILRRYIENRFGINAPEQTTEEFLAGLSLNRDFPKNFRPLLKEFLTHCDMVKFAAYHPSEDDIQKTFNLCKNFILETKTENEGNEESK